MTQLIFRCDSCGLTKELRVVALQSTVLSKTKEIAVDLVRSIHKRDKPQCVGVCVLSEIKEI
jgi:hypothetical protein